MLIPFRECVQLLSQFGIKVKGILHVGSHDCEEITDYVHEGVSPQNVYWIDANAEKVASQKARGIPNVYCQAIDSQEGEVEFYITNNGQSSSLLEFGTHAQSYPHVTVSHVEKVKTDTLKNWIQKNNIPIQDCTFWNFDIQGKELDALKSAGEFINYAKSLYLEVNTQEVYKGCGLIQEIDSYLSNYGFSRVKLSMTTEGWGDALYVQINN